MDDNTQQQKSQNTSQNPGMTDTPATAATQQSQTQSASPEANTIVSASQMGVNGPMKEHSTINMRRLAIRIVIGVAALLIIFAVLVLTNIIPLKEFKTTSYTTSKGTKYSLLFYAKNNTKTSNSESTQLVSKVSKDGKFPIIFSLSSTAGETGYNKLKECSGYKKVGEVENKNLNKTIAICDLTPEGAGEDGVYVAAFLSDGQSQVIAIGQDYGEVGTTTADGAQEALKKFGLKPYISDIEKIIGSIKTQ
jgi:hypothetical protein